jgi:eukaryotic-like serine/threonine-protein kinase
MLPASRCPDPSRFREHLDGSLREEEQAGLIAHLDHCEACRLAIEELAAGDGRLLALAREVGRDSMASGLPYRGAVTRPHEQGTERDAGTEPAAEGPLPLDFLDPTDRPGHLGRLGPFEVLEVRGCGGMGVVFRAFDGALHRVVALKVMAPQLAVSPVARQRFVREAKAAAAVRDEHVVAIHAVGEAKGLPYLVMEYIDGQSLQERLDGGGPLPVPEVLRIGAQVAAGLAAAHAQGLVHRDVKPANILIDRNGQAKLTDFGLARAADDTRLTQSGVVAGTPQYMAPEQGRGEAVDLRADLFSLGSVLYAMCTGAPPFRGEGHLAVLKRVCEEAPQAPHEVNPAAPRWLSQVIAWLHSKDRTERFPSAGELSALLREGLAHLREPGWVPEALRRRRGRRPPARVVAAVCLLSTAALFLAAAGVGLYHLGTAGGPPEDTQPTGGLPTAPAAAVTVVREHRRFEGHKDVVRCVALSPDGRWALSGSGRPGVPDPAEDCTLRLWDVASGRQEHGFVVNEQRPRFPEEVVAVAFTPAGGEVLAVSKSSLLRWDLATKQPSPGFPHRPDDDVFRTAAISTDGRRALTSPQDGNLSLWDLERGQRLARLQAHDEAILSAAFTPDGRALVAGGGRLDEKGIPRVGIDYAVRLWDLTPGQEKEVRRFSRHAGFVWGVACAPDGNRIVSSATGFGAIRVWEADTGSQRYLVPGLERGVWAVAFVPDGRRFLSAGADGLVRLWDTESGRELCSFEGHQGAVHSLACSADGRWLLSGGADATVRLWPVPEPSSP